MEKKSKLVLFDGNAIIHRAYHALPSTLTTRVGEPINAVYGLVSTLLRVIQDLKPTYIAFAFDTPEPTFRHIEFEDYQAHRPEADEDLVGQFDKAQDVIRAMHIPVFTKKGYEADDVIGTIANRLQTTDYRKKAVDDGQSAVDVIIVTGDRDMLQLVDDIVKLYMPGKNLSDAREFGRRETIETMGVPPEQIVDFKALVGDPSDNYKGIPGIGPKTAIKLLTEYKRLETIYENLNRLPERVKKLLEENRQSALQSQRLAKIVCDVDLDFNLEDAKKWRVDSEELLKIFDEFGFKSLRRRVVEVGKQKQSENQLKLKL